VSLAPSVFDSHALLRMTLASYGLTQTSLADWALEMLIAGKPIETILLELEQRPEFKAAFPEIEARRNRGIAEGIQLEPINPSIILEYRTRARALFRSFGVPSSMWDTNEDFASFIVGDVSMDELNSRLSRASERVYQAPPEVRAVFFDLFGIDGDTALFALHLDATKAEPFLENMVQMAEAGGAARRLGFGLTAAEMTRMEAANISYDQALEGFRILDAKRGLFEETLAEEGTDFGVGDIGIGAAFSLEGGATEALDRRAGAREAETKGSSQAATTDVGAIGLGAAGRRQ
jgi:hypothetical protein